MQRLRGVRAVGVLLGAARGEDHRGRAPRRASRTVSRRSATGHAGDPLDPVRPVRARPPARTASKPVGALRDVRLVDQALPDREVQQAVGQREVGARQRLQVQRAPLRRWRCAAGRPRCAARRRPGRASRYCMRRRHRLGRVAADQQHRVGVGDVRERERQPAVDAERAVRRGGRRRHAEPAVVVDRERAQRDPGELARAGTPSRWSARRRRSSRPRPGRSAAWAARIAVGDPVQRLVPGRRRAAGRPAPSPGPAGWSAGPGGRAARRRSSPSTHSPPRLTGKSRPVELDASRRSGGRQRDAALQRAVRAVRGDGVGGHSDQHAGLLLPTRCGQVTAAASVLGGEYVPRWENVRTDGDTFGREAEICRRAAAATIPARIYVCGITPYDVTHLGHAATFVWADVVRRRDPADRGRRRVTAATSPTSTTC